MRGGIERIFVELLRRSRHDWTVFTHHFEPESTYPELRDVRIVELSPRVSVRRALVPLVKASAVIASARLPLDGHRALLVSSEGLGDLVLLRNRVPSVCYCHTPLKIVYDQAVRKALASYDTRKAFARNLIGPIFATVERRLWRRYQHVFANSSETRTRLRDAGLEPAGIVEILRPGVDVRRFPFGAGGRDPFFLVAGRIMWQKNIELAIDALSLLSAEGTKTSMIVAGTVDQKSALYLADLRRRAAGLPVTFEVDPTDERLSELYRGCAAVVFTPRNEDFGIVPIEAMASGAVVLAVDAGGPRESVIDNQTGWLLPPTPDAFAGQMRHVLHAGSALDPMRKSARDHATSFAWEPFVERLDDVMEAVASGASEHLQRAP